jgi:hypothetical protein
MSKKEEKEEKLTREAISSLAAAIYELTAVIDKMYKKDKPSKKKEELLLS